LTLPKIETKKIIVGLVITVAGLMVVMALRFTGTLESAELSWVDFRFFNARSVKRRYCYKPDRQRQY